MNRAEKTDAIAEDDGDGGEGSPRVPHRLPGHQRPRRHRAPPAGPRDRLGVRRRQEHARAPRLQGRPDRRAVRALHRDDRRSPTRRPTSSSWRRSSTSSARRTRRSRSRPPSSRAARCPPTALESLASMPTRPELVAQARRPPAVADAPPRGRPVDPAAQARDDDLGRGRAEGRRGLRPGTARNRTNETRTREETRRTKWPFPSSSSSAKSRGCPSSSSTTSSRPSRRSSASRPR